LNTQEDFDQDRARSDLETWVTEIKKSAEELASDFEDLVAEGHPVHQVIHDTGERFVGLLEFALRDNATLFEARPDDAERKLRLELDDSLRLQLNTIRKLLKLPTREG